MEVVIRVDGGDRADDELRSLREWLIAHETLRGRVELTTTPPAPGRLGAVTDALTIALGSGGAIAASATALSTVLITWIRRRTGGITVKLTKPDGATIEYHAENVRQLSASEIRDATTQLVRQLDHDG
ncbi:hypothetical protein [Nocardia sp. NPDC051570]|uniref:effector-associated constant component EACC1 n=1 Tax=Nocardia sp. NPDC051570 TaxID=3364324 RepID=UPI0037AA9EF5